MDTTVNANVTNQQAFILEILQQNGITNFFVLQDILVELENLVYVTRQSMVSEMAA